MLQVSVLLEVIFEIFANFWAVYTGMMGRPRRRWEDNIKMDFREVGGGCGDWMDFAQEGRGGGHLWLR